jgi:uncharacterized membrane protein YecN with MAPEG domain
VPLYAALLALFFIYLSFRVIGTRRRERVAIGTGGKPMLARRQRVHGNFAEYVPFALILLTFVEMHRWAFWIVHILCVLLLLGRLLHAYGVAQENEDFRLRTAGMVTTFVVLGVGATLLLFDALRAL